MSADSSCTKRRRVDNCGMEQLLELLLVKDDASRLNPNALNDAILRVMQRQASDDDKHVFLQKSLSLGSQLQNLSSNLIRQQASMHNTRIWPFTHDLSVKIFSEMGTECICRAAAACTMFNKFAMDAACYTSIDLSKTGRVSDEAVAKLIKRAGRCLKTLKLGLALSDNKMMVLPTTKLPLGEPELSPTGVWSLCILSRSCLRPLEASGANLKTLHLYNIEGVDSKFLCKTLMACSSLVDLAIVELKVSVMMIMNCLGSTCHELEILTCREARPSKNIHQWQPLATAETIGSSACNALVKGCPKITALTFRNYWISDSKVAALLTGLLHLTYANFSGTDYFRGTCLRDIVRDQTVKLKTLILRDCNRLKEAEVEHFLSGLSAGECKTLQHLDLSGKRFEISAESISKLQSERPGLCLVVHHQYHSDCDSGSLDYSDHTSDYSDFGCSSYSSSQSERDGSFVGSMYDEDSGGGHDGFLEETFSDDSDEFEWGSQSQEPRNSD